MIHATLRAHSKIDYAHAHLPEADLHLPLRLRPFLPSLPHACRRLQSTSRLQSQLVLSLQAVPAEFMPRATAFCEGCVWDDRFPDNLTLKAARNFVLTCLCQRCRLPVRVQQCGDCVMCHIWPSVNLTHVISAGRPAGHDPLQPLIVHIHHTAASC